MCDDVASILLLRAQCRGTEMSVNRCMLGYFQLRSHQTVSHEKIHMCHHVDENGLMVRD